MRPTSSIAAATCSCLWVSTPPIIWPSDSRAIVAMPPLSSSLDGGVARTAGRADRTVMGPLHRRLFGHGRSSGACTNKASHTRPTDHLQDTLERGRPLHRSDRVSETLAADYQD